MTLDLTQSLPSHVRATSGRPVEDSTLMEVWQGLSAAIVDQIADNWAATTERYAKGRQEHYFSAEFLMGRALLNNLSNLGLVEKAREALAAYGLDLGQVLEEEPDAALGNGGLGRLAACFLDSCATLDLPVRGYGIATEYVDRYVAKWGSVMCREVHPQLMGRQYDLADPVDGGKFYMDGAGDKCQEVVEFAIRTVCDMILDDDGNVREL